MPSYSRASNSPNLKWTLRLQSDVSVHSTLILMMICFLKTGPRINELYLHLCFPNEQVFDEDGYRKKNGLNLKLEYNSKKQSESSRKVLMSEVTTRDLLEFTPKLDEIFGSCQLRQTKNDHDSMRTFEGKQCNERFKVIKYLSNTNCCLKLALPLWKGSLQDTDVAFDPFSDGILRSITLNNTLFDRVAAFKAFFTVEASRGYKELKTAPRIDRGYDYNNVTTFYNYFGMRYHVVSCTELKFGLVSYSDIEGD